VNLATWAGTRIQWNENSSDFISWKSHKGCIAAIKGGLPGELANHLRNRRGRCNFGWMKAAVTWSQSKTLQIFTPSFGNPYEFLTLCPLASRHTRFLVEQRDCMLRPRL
jgi:hypothetical protein